MNTYPKIDLDSLRQEQLLIVIFRHWWYAKTFW